MSVSAIDNNCVLVYYIQKPRNGTNVGSHVVSSIR